MFHEPILWGIRQYWNLYGSDYLDNVPCAIVGGKILYAELEFDGNAIATQRDGQDMLTKGGVRIFEVDDKAGTWKLAVRHALKDFIPNLQNWNMDFQFPVGSYAIDIVKCMGGVYILIPASLDISMMVTEEIKQLYNLSDGAQSPLRYKDCGFLPVRFYVLQLQGNALRCGQALIQSPHGMCDKHDFRTHWMEKLVVGLSTRWYRCRGYGSIINIMVDQYVIRYDVMTGVSTTQFLPKGFYCGYLDPIQPDVAYRPSLHRKP